MLDQIKHWASNREYKQIDAILISLPKSGSLVGEMVEIALATWDHRIQLREWFKFVDRVKLDIGKVDDEKERSALTSRLYSKE